MHWKGTLELTKTQNKSHIYKIIFMQALNLIILKSPWETKVWIEHTSKGRWHPNNNSTRPAMGREPISL